MNIALLSKSINCLGDFLPRLIDALPHPGDVKDAFSGRYIIHNWHLAKVFGRGETDFCGLTVREAAPIGNKLRGKFLRDIERMEHQVILSKQAVLKENSIISAHLNKILISDVIKTPILGKNQKVVAILTYSYDVTEKCDLFHLFSLYTQFYTRKHAVQYFLKFLQVDTYFSEMPTHKEILSLLAMYFDTIYKQVSKRLDIKLRTVEAHKRNLQVKLKDTSLREIIIAMRSSSRYMCA